MRPFIAMVRKDLQLFFTDRRAVIMSFVAPIAIASFFGSIFASGGGNREAAKIPIAIVDRDDSAISKSIVTGAGANRALQVTTPDTEGARADVKAGRVTVAVVIPPGFGDAAGRAFFAGRERPDLTLMYDPSHAMELGFVRGMLTEHIMQAVSAEMFTGDQGRKVLDDTLQGLDSKAPGLSGSQSERLRDLLQSARRFYTETGRAADAPAGAGGLSRGFTMPYSVSEQAITSGDKVAYNGYAHSFAGMSVQFLLFAAIDLGVGVLLERQRGLWKRLRSAPISRFALLLGKSASGAVIALMTLLVSFTFAMIVFGVRIEGSIAGFAAVAVTTAIMASTFGLLIASLGHTPGGTRGIASLSVLLMVMLGGAWVPTFVFPAWLQRLTVVVPARWAVDGFDAVTWRGLGFGAALTPALVMLGFALVFGSLAISRFRWDEV